MEVFQIVGVGIIATTFALVLRQHRPEFALQISIVTGLVIFMFVVNQLNYVVQVLNDLAQRIDLDMIYFSTILKIIGIAYITEFGAQICRDAGEQAIASKIELGGKVIIIVIAVPILTAILDLIIKIMP